MFDVTLPFDVGNQVPRMSRHPSAAGTRFRLLHCALSLLQGDILPRSLSKNLLRERVYQVLFFFLFLMILPIFEILIRDFGRIKGKFIYHLFISNSLILSMVDFVVGYFVPGLSGLLLQSTTMPQQERNGTP